MDVIMKHTKRRKVIGVIAAIIAVILAVQVWFRIPFSPLKSEFQKDVEQLAGQGTTTHEVFTKDEFSHLPTALQKYVETCGYIGTPKMNCLVMEYHDVAFKQGKDGPDLTIDYVQYDFANEPARIAFIDSSLFGIPFEGYDYYMNGIGGMKGVIAKGITIFDTRGEEIDKACLVTYLSESLFAPSIILDDRIVWEEISDHEVRGTITYKGQHASGIFRFNDDYEYISFTTEDRTVSNNDGTMEYIPWSAECGEYEVADNGIKYPTRFRAVWHYPDSDLVYFDGKIASILYDVNEPVI